MTEQLMDDLSNEEHEASLLMCGHAVGPPLSPAAKAVLDAANGKSSWGADDILNDSRWIAAAALRAAADQLRKAYANEEYVDHADDWLNDIAAELEAYR